jgi:hypothetical protein
MAIARELAGPEPLVAAFDDSLAGEFRRARVRNTLVRVFDLSVQAAEFIVLDLLEPDEDCA